MPPCRLTPLTCLLLMLVPGQVVSSWPLGMGSLSGWWLCSPYLGLGVSLTRCWDCWKMEDIGRCQRLLFYSQSLFCLIPAALVVNSGMCHPGFPSRATSSLVIQVVGGRAEAVPQQSFPKAQPCWVPSHVSHPLFLTVLTHCQLGELMGKWSSAKKHQFRCCFKTLV